MDRGAARLWGMRRLGGPTGIAIGAAIVLLITAGSARAQRRMRFESLGGFELFRRIVDESGKAGVTVGGSIGFTRAGNGAEEALAGLRYAARSGRTDYLSLDSRLTASPGGAGDPLLEGTHRAIARVGNLKLDLDVDHSALGRSYSLRPDVSGAPYRDVSAGATFDLVFKSLREGAVVAPIEVRGRRVAYQDGHPGLSSIEISAGVGTRFDGRREYDEKKEAFGTIEMFNVTYIGTRVEGTMEGTSAAQPQPRSAPASTSSTMTGGGHRIHQFDFRLLNYDQMFFRDGPFAFTMFVRLGYGYLYDATTGEDGGAGIFRYGSQMGDDKAAAGLTFSVGPGTSDTGEIVSTWRVEMLLHSRKPKLGAWDLRFGWTCATPEKTDDLCGQGAVGRSALELEAYLELSREWQLGASYLGDYGPWRGTSEWRNEALAFLRWDVSR